MPTPAEQLAAALSETQRRIVFAESCTAGLVSSCLAAVPGVSQWHCGAAVTYRNLTKQGWLGVSADDIERHTAVSETVARQMAAGVLRKTPEADIACSVTGHLGPHAPEGQDGLVFVGAACRDGDSIADLPVLRWELEATSRLDRQAEAARKVLLRAFDVVATFAATFAARSSQPQTPDATDTPDTPA